MCRELPLHGPSGLARGGSTADAGLFLLQRFFNGEVFQHYFPYGNLTLSNYFYGKCPCSTMAGLHAPRRQACRRSSGDYAYDYNYTYYARTTATTEARPVAPFVEE